MFITNIVFIVIAVFIHVAIGKLSLWGNERSTLSRTAGHNRKNFTQLARKFGQPCEEHEVITEDGYITKLFRLPGNKRKPVFLTHGNLGSADDYILRGHKSLPVALRKEGYDVWLGNCRGNRYSRKHVHLNPDRDSRFWDFSFEQCAVFDTASAIDYILHFSGLQQLPTIGYSVGTTLFYVLTAEKPDYNKKISVTISMAPIAFLHNSKTLVESHKYDTIQSYFLGQAGIEELNIETALNTQLFRSLCTHETSAMLICLDLWGFSLGGYDNSEIEPEFAPLIFRYWPSSTSRKSQQHLVSIGRSRRFAKFDYGYKKNLRIYGTELPTEYDLNAVGTKVALISGKNDWISTLEDVELLKHKLPNVVDHVILEFESFNHYDFTWARNAPTLLFPHIFDLLKKHG